MTPALIGLLVAGGIILALVLWFIAAYNGLVRLRNQVREAFSQIDVQLKRRHDLVPNLVETVKGYATHERETLDSVIRARTQAVAAKTTDEKLKAEQNLSGWLGRLMVVAEQYPDLKANQNFLSLQEELTSTENKIGFARGFYNERIMTYNTRLQSIPDNIIAGMFNFKEEPFFEVADQVQREAPKVKF